MEKVKKRWKCKYCDGINSRKDLYCVSCGARWSEMTNTSKETYTEEEQPVETYVYSDEEQKENSLVEEHAEIEHEQKNLSSSHKEPFISFDEVILTDNIKKFMFAAVILPLMIVCVSYLFDTMKELLEESVEELAATVEEMESMNTYSEDLDEYKEFL